jgi:eukaryotic-like serine/threonine-protein kinase
VTREARARMQRHRFEITNLLRRDDPDLPPPIFSLLDRMVRFDPNERFQTYDQLLDTIRQVKVEMEGGQRLSASASGPKTVFVVEQNPKFQDAFRDRLKARGYRVLISINASQAVSRYQQQPYDALIVNCVTADRPGLDAYERVLREAELKRMDCAGILIVSKDQEHWADDLNGLPKSAALVFPVSMKQIVQKLSEFVPAEKDVSGKA